MVRPVEGSHYFENQTEETVKKIQSPQTTIAAIVILVSAVFQFALVPLTDGDPATGIAFKELGAAAIIFYGFWKSRDQKQHDKDVGAA